MIFRRDSKELEGGRQPGREDWLCHPGKGWRSGKPWGETHRLKGSCTAMSLWSAE